MHAAMNRQDLKHAPCLSRTTIQLAVNQLQQLQTSFRYDQSHLCLQQTVRGLLANQMLVVARSINLQRHCCEPNGCDTTLLSRRVGADHAPFRDP